MTLFRTAFLLVVAASFLSAGSAAAQDTGEFNHCTEFPERCPVETTTAEPVVNQNLTTARTAAFTSFTMPRNASSSTSAAAAATSPSAAAADETADDESKSGVRMGEFSSDMEYEFFEAGSIKGNNMAIRAGYARETADANWVFGLNGVFNKMGGDFAGTDGINYYVVQGFVNRFLSMSLDAETYVGASVNALMGDVANNTFSVGLHAAQKRYVGPGMLTFGVMFQGNKAGGISTAYGNAAIQYGFPIGNTLSINADCLVAYNVFSDGTDNDPTEKILLNPGASLTYYPSRTFGINLGAKTVLLVDNFSSIEIVTGARFRF